PNQYGCGAPHNSATSAADALAKNAVGRSSRSSACRCQLNTTCGADAVSRASTRCANCAVRCGEQCGAPAAACNARGRYGDAAPRGGHASSLKPQIQSW